MRLRASTIVALNEDLEMMRAEVRRVEAMLREDDRRPARVAIFDPFDDTPEPISSD